jgi:hypothetical protein
VKCLARCSISGRGSPREKELVSSPYFSRF